MTRRIKALDGMLASVSSHPIASASDAEALRTTLALGAMRSSPKPRAFVMIAQGKRFGLHQIGSLFGRE